MLSRTAAPQGAEKPGVVRVDGLPFTKGDHQDVLEEVLGVRIGDAVALEDQAQARAEQRPQLFEPRGGRGRRAR